MKLNKIRLREKFGGQGSGNFDHSGRPGEVGGSGEGSGGGNVGAQELVKKLTMSGGDIGNLKVNQEVRRSLQKTIEDKSYVLYRGIGVVKGRVTAEQMKQAENLRPGDTVPDFLQKQGNEWASFSQLKSVARSYSEGKIRVVVEARPSKENILVDTANLRKAGFDVSDSDHAYFQSDKEVIIHRSTPSIIYSISR